MAIKGKRKSRGSQGQRRPAAAPRPVYTAQRRRRSWWRTTEGLMVLGVLGAVAIGLVIWGIASARSAAAEREDAQEALESYTGALRGLISELGEPVSDMTAAPAGVDDAAVEELEDDAAGWTTQLQAVQTNLFGLPTAPGTQGATDVIEQAILLYISAADTYALVPTIDDDKLAERILVRAAAQRDSANRILESALTVLDTARAEAGMDPAGLTPPGTLNPQTQPGVVPTPGATGGGTVVVPGEGDGGKADNKNGGKEGGGDNKDGGGGQGG